jgi:hypothetical protein
MSAEKADDAIEFVFEEEDDSVSSGTLLNAEAAGVLALPDEMDGDEEMSPVFKELASPKLPPLARENRAWLQMQSPNKLHFYWSVRSNPFQTLSKAIGSETGSYTFVLRLIDLKRDAETVIPIDAEGSTWFSVDADSEYRAEIGFYSPSRPFVRVMYSNTVHTPRKSPSPRAATDADWRIPAQKFAEVLDVAGFRQDAFDVAIAGDDIVEAETLRSEPSAAWPARRLPHLPATMPKSFATQCSRSPPEQRSNSFASASANASLHCCRASSIRSTRQRRWPHSSPNSRSMRRALAEEEEFGPAVFGASLVNFPRRTRLRTRPRGFDRLSKFEPISS